MTKATALEDAQIAAHIAQVDAVAFDMEQKWGVGRLTLLVDPELAARFQLQAQAFNKAIYPPDGLSAKLAHVKQQAEATIRGWVALDRAAVAAGARSLDPATWEAKLPNGAVLAVCRSSSDAHHVARQAFGRQVYVWTLDEVARVVSQYELVNLSKEVFPGATVRSVRDPTGPAPFFDDDLPDEMLPPERDAAE